MFNFRLQEAVVNAVQTQEDAVPHLEKEKMRLQTELAAVQDKLDSANLALERARNFPVELDGNYLCPSCWVQGSKSFLTPIPGTDREDVFRCHACGDKFADAI